MDYFVLLVFLHITLSESLYYMLGDVPKGADPEGGVSKVGLADFRGNLSRHLIKPSVNVLFFALHRIFCVKQCMISV